VVLNNTLVYTKKKKTSNLIRDDSNGVGGVLIFSMEVCTTAYAELRLHNFDPNQGFSSNQGCNEREKKCNNGRRVIWKGGQGRSPSWGDGTFVSFDKYSLRSPVTSK